MQFTEIIVIKIFIFKMSIYDGIQFDNKTPADELTKMNFLASPIAHPWKKGGKNSFSIPSETKYFQGFE